MEQSQPTAALAQPTELRRDLGVWSAAAIVVGTVIGSGIFLVPKTMINQVGTQEAVFLVWIVGGLLSLFGALTYAELGAALPEAGGEYAYLREAYGPFWAFLNGWTQLWVARGGSVATLAAGFFTFLANFWPELDRVIGHIPIPLGTAGGPLEVRSGQLWAMGVILGLGLLNYFGVRFGGQVQVLVTAVKVGMIVALIIIGFTASNASWSNFNTSVPAPGGVAGFFAALVAALWAYDGWNNLTMVASEVKRPQRNVPLVLIAGSLTVMAIYLLTSLAYVHVLSAPEIASSDRVPTEMMRKLFGASGANLISVAAMVSIFAALNGSLLSGSRIPYAMARDGYFFSAVAYVHPRYRTPSVSILLLAGWAAILVLSGRYDQLLTYVVFASWIFYGLTAGAMLVLRRKQPNLARPYRTTGYPIVPIVFIAVAAMLLVATLVQSPRESVMGLLLMAVGVPFYWYWRRKHV